MRYTDRLTARRLVEASLDANTADLNFRRNDGKEDDYYLDLCPYAFASWNADPAWSTEGLISVLPARISNKKGDFNLSINMDGDGGTTWHSVSYRSGNTVIQQVTRRELFDSVLDMVFFALTHNYITRNTDD